MSRNHIMKHFFWFFLVSSFSVLFALEASIFKNDFLFVLRLNLNPQCITPGTSD